MTRYYKMYDDSNSYIIAIGTGYGGTEITEEEYGHFMNHILKAGQNPGSAQEPDSSNR